MRKQRWDFLDKSVLWKGDEAGYTAKHDAIRKYHKKSSCEDCGTSKNLQMANISGEYKRDPSDWKTLCAKCHFHFDNMPARIRIHYPLGISGHRGVKTMKNGFCSRITIDYKEVYLGYFSDIENAIMIRLAAEEQLINKET